MATEDESIFVQDVKVRRVWAGAGIRPIRVVSGSHFRTAVFGAISIDGRQIFRQYDVFDGPSFLDFLKKLHGKFGPMYLFLDKARQHRRTKIVTEYMRQHRRMLRVRWIPTASPEFDAMEECWRQGEKDLSALPRFPTTLQDLKTFLAGYYRTRRFDLDMRGFLLTSRCFPLTKLRRPGYLEGRYTLDSSVLVEMLAGTHTGGQLSSRLEKRVLTGHTCMVNIAEAGYILCRKIGHAKALTAIRALLDSRVLYVEEGEEVHAAVSRIKCARAISLGDSYTIAVSELTSTRPVFLTRENDMTLEMSREPFKLEPLFLR
ncbi:MAG: transposase [Nitrososphaerota archaeon]|nr:transposase [Nitrososphaerota archaeon]